VRRSGPRWSPRRLAAALLGLCALGFAPPIPAHAEEPTELEVFTRPGCPHCARAEAFLAALEARGEARVVRRDVSADAQALARLRRLAADSGQPPGVPAFHAGGRLLVGFRSAAESGPEIEALLAHGAAAAGAIALPWLGPLRAGEVGLPLFTLAIGLLDGFNPCAMWVLLFLLSLLVRLESRRRMLAIGGTFVAVGGLVYYAFLAAWLGAFLWIGVARGIQAALGLVAIAMGALHLKDALAPGRGPSLHIPAAAKPRIYARVRRVLDAENLPAAMAAVAVLALLVNFVELLCTAGLPALYTRVLTLHELPAWRYHAYLGLYVAAYVFDDALVLAAAVAAFGAKRLQQRGGRWLDALSGALLVALGALLALRPQWLSALGGG
jgi:glutaredoxin